MKRGIGARIKHLRESRGWSQMLLGEKVGLNNSVLSRIEDEKRPVQDAELIRFCEVFNVAADDLLGISPRSLSVEAQNVLNSLDLSDEEIRRMFPFELDGRPVTEDEFRWFIASVRSKRSMEEF